MQLPCRHIFAVRKRYDMSLYEPSLCAVRWRKDYYQSCHRVLRHSEEPTSSAGSVNIHQLSADKKTTSILSAQEKYRKAFNVAQKLASLVSEAPMRDYYHKMKCLEHLHTTWEQEDVAMDDLFYEGKFCGVRGKINFSEKHCHVFDRF